MKLWLRWHVRAALTLLFVAGMPFAARAQPAELRLEYPQEGDPKHPRALILIHGVQPNPLGGVFDGRNTWVEKEGAPGFLNRWGDQTKNWALRQYCSVYTFNYDARLQSMAPAPDVGAQLYNLILHNSIINKSDPNVQPSNPQQPSPTFLANVESAPVKIILIGHSNGGLVARETAVKLVSLNVLHLASVSNPVLDRLVYLGTPLDGELVNDFAPILTAFALSVDINSLQRKDIKAVGKGYRWILTLKNSRKQEQFKSAYNPVYQKVLNFTAYGVQEQESQSLSIFSPPPLTTPQIMGFEKRSTNVAYGKGVVIKKWKDQKPNDGLVTKNSALGIRIGPQQGPAANTVKVKEISEPWVSLWDFKHSLHGKLPTDLRFLDWVTYPCVKGSPSDEFSGVLDSKELASYLSQRETIEQYYSASIKVPLVLGFYWDPRQRIDKPFCVAPDALYRYMWSGMSAEAIKEDMKSSTKAATH